CPEHPDAASPFRKPEPGMFLAIAERFNAPLVDVPVVGDSESDLRAAVAAGARPILVLTGKGQRARANGILPSGTAVYPDLAAVAEALCPCSCCARSPSRSGSC